jgi:glycogen synthase
MKVLMFGWEFPPMSSGGLGTACYGLTKGLGKKGVEITFVLPYSAESNFDFVKVRSVNGAKNIKIRKIRSVLQPYMNSNSYHTSVRKQSAVQSKIYGSTLFDEVQRYTIAAGQIAEEEEFDVIHCHDWMTFGAGLTAKKRKNKPLVMHVHSTELDRTGNHSVNQHVYDLERKGLHGADKIIAVSNFTKKKIVEHYGINPDKIEVVHNAVDLSIYPQNNNFEIKKLSRIVLFLGRLTLQKGPDYFLEAAKKVIDIEKNVKFVMAGTGDMESRMIERAAELGIADKVLFSGFLQNEDVDRAYKMADIYVMSSVSEPFGITTLEAMKNGTPVLISKQSGVSEVISHALKVNFWDINDTSSKILSLLRYKPLHKSLAENGHSEVQKFTWDLPAEKCIRVYNMLTGMEGNNNEE